VNKIIIGIIIVAIIVGVITVAAYISNFNGVETAGNEEQISEEIETSGKKLKITLRESVGVQSPP